MLSQKSVTASSSCVINVPSNELDVNNLTEDVATNSCCSSQTSSIYSSAVDICRICHCESTPDAPLITPCYCSGSLRYVHQSCLQQWIKSSNTRCCELCKFQFIMQTKIKPFNEWEYLEMSGLERKKLLCAMLFHIIAMTCVCWSLYVLIDRTLDEVQRGHLDWPFWTKLIVVGIGFMGGIVFMYIQCKAYFILCQRWKAYNRVIYVQNAPEKPSTLHATSGNSAPLESKELCNGPSSKSYGNYHKDSNQTASCIDIKGVRNLHIFFNEDNRIRFHKQDRPVVSAQNKRIESNPVVTNERLLTSAEDNEFRRNNNGSSGNNNNKIDTLVCDRDASWHIEIGNGVDCYNGCSSIDKPSTSQDRSFCAVDNETGCVNATCGSGGSDHYGGALCPSDLLATGKAKIDIIDASNNKMENSAEMPSSVVTLQIKKTEIVIEFGGQSNNSNNNNNNNNNTSTTNNNNNDNNNNDSNSNNNLNSASYRDSEQMNKSDLSSDNRDASITNNDEEETVDVDKKVLNTTATLINEKQERVTETEEKQEAAHEKKIEGDTDFAADTNSESLLPTTKLLKKNHSSVSLNNIQNNKDVHQITDWNSTDNLLSIP